MSRVYMNINACNVGFVVRGVPHPCMITMLYMIIGTFLFYACL